MARQRHSETGRSRRRTATSPEQREQQLADIAYDLAEEQMLSGTASSQVITHFLKMGSTRERIEQLEKQHEIELKKARMEQIASGQRIEALFADAVNAFRGYAGGLNSGEEMDGHAVED